MASLSALYSKANIAPDRQVTTPTTATSATGGNRISRFLEKNPLKEKEKFVGIVTDAGFVPDEDTIERIKRNPELKKKLPNMTPTGDGGFTCDAGYFENVTITHCPTLSEQARASPIGLATTGKVVQKNDYEYAQHTNAKHFNRMDYRRVIVHDSGVLFVYHLLKNHLPGSYPSPVVCGSRTSNPYVCMMKKMFPDGGGGSGGNHDVAWVTKMNNRALQKVPEGCAQSGILMDLQLLNPGDHKDMKAEQLLDWAGEIPSALYHKAGKLIARSQVLDRSFRTKIFDGNASETHCVGAGESTGEMKTNTIFRPSVPDDDDQGASLLDDQDTSDKMLREAMVLLEKLKKRNVVRKWKNNKLQQRFSTWGHCAMGYLQMHPPFSNPELAIQEWEIAAKGGCQIARYNIAMAILRGDYGVHDIDRKWGLWGVWGVWGVLGWLWLLVVVAHVGLTFPPIPYISYLHTYSRHGAEQRPSKTQRSPRCDHSKEGRSTVGQSQKRPPQ